MVIVGVWTVVCGDRWEVWLLWVVIERCIRNVVGGDRGRCGLLWEVIDGGVECCGR